MSSSTAAATSGWLSRRSANDRIHQREDRRLDVLARRAAVDPDQAELARDGGVALLHPGGDARRLVAWLACSRGGRVNLEEHREVGARDARAQDPGPKRMAAVAELEIDEVVREPAIRDHVRLLACARDSPAGERILCRHDHAPYPADASPRRLVGGEAARLCL